MKQADGVPRCANCGGLVKPDVVLYEEGLDSEVLTGAIEDIAQAERIAHLLKDSRDDGTLSMQLCAYAVAWVLLNPKVLPPLGADYSR